jgi:hypothetical protein
MVSFLYSQQSKDIIIGKNYSKCLWFLFQDVSFQGFALAQMAYEITSLVSNHGLYSTIQGTPYGELTLEQELAF